MSAFAPAPVRADQGLQWAAHPVAFPLLRALDRLAPAARLPGIGVVVNDPDLIRAVLTDQQRFRRDGPNSPGRLWTPVLGPRALTNLEDAEHRRLRGAVSGLFGAAESEALVARHGGTLLAGLTAELAAGRPVELAGWTRRFISAVLGGLLGTGDGRDLAGPAQRLTAMVGPRTRQLPPACAAAGRAMVAEVTAPVAGAWARSAPGTVPGRLRERGFGVDDARSTAGVLLVTGTETVSSFLPRLAALLLGSGLPEPTDELLDDALRLTVPTPATLRRAAVATRIGGVRVAAGERVLVVTLNGAWNRRATGDSLRQLWFGAGPHFCIGRALALAEARALAAALAGAAREAGRPLRVLQARPRRRVLIPGWATLVVGAGP
jgi:cytochrome P450